MLRALAIVFFFLICFTNSAQNRKIDSLLNNLKTADKYSYRNIFRELENELLWMNKEEAIRVVERLNSVTANLNFYGPLSSSYRCSAIVLEKNGKINKAIEAIAKANQIATEYQLEVEKADNLRVLGDIYRYTEKFNLAYRNYMEALKQYDKLEKYHADIFLVYAHLGDVYYRTKHFSLSRKYLLKAYQNGKGYLHSRTLINSLNTIGLIYRHNNKFTHSLFYHNKALAMAIEVKDSAWIGIANGNLGRIYQLQKNYDQALECYKKDIYLSQKYEQWGDAIITMSRIADVYIDKNQYPLAEVFLDSALNVADRNHQYDAKIHLYEVLTKYYRQLNKIDKAFEYQSLYNNVKDSLEKKTFNDELDEIRATFELEKKQSRIELLEKKNQIITASEQRKNFILILVITLLLFIALITFLLYKSNNQKIKANELLQQQQKELFDKNEEINRQNEEIKALNNSLEIMVEERTAQLQEALDHVLKQNQNLEQFSYVISHNLRSPIAQILGLISVFNREKPGDPNNINIINFLDKSAHNLDSIVDDLNRILLIRNQSQEGKERIILKEAAQQTVESMQQIIGETGSKIEMDFSEVDILYTNKSYLNSILYNLMSNAIKYRSSDRPPLINIKTEKADSFVCLSVQDNGLGLDLERINPEKLFKLYHRMHFHTEGKGMGLFIVKEQVESLNGRIEVESEPGVGTKFNIYLPAA